MSIFNPTILGRPLFPSQQVTGDFLRGVGRSVAQALTPAAGTPPATMAGVSIPPAGASFSQLQYKGPLLGTGPMFGLRGEQQPAPQPARQPYNYGPYAATMGLPSFDVTKTQTPFNQYSAAAPQQISSALAMPPSGQAQAPSQPAPIITTPPSDGRFKFTFQGAEPMSERRGTIMATPEQLTNLNARTTAYEGRTPEQQAALLANIRKTGAGIREDIASSQINSFVNRTEPNPTYTTPSGAPIKAPTNMFGRPNASFTGIYGERSPVNEAALARMGRGTRTSPIAGGPQPSSALNSYFPLVEDRNRNPFGSIYGFGV
jgi:hypothetical protein